MVFANQASLLCQLLDLKGRLRSAVSSDGPSEDLRRLLQEVDLALGRLTEGTHGLCEMCADPIELNRLEADPLIRTCLAQLSLCEQRMLEHDLDLAHQVQKSLLPANDLQVDGWETAYHYAAAGPVSGESWATFAAHGWKVATDNVPFVIADDPGIWTVSNVQLGQGEASNVATAKDECKKGGWANLTRADGTSFKNQGDCVAWVETAGRNAPG